jgi:large subunit ribosomal protein L20
MPRSVNSVAKRARRKKIMKQAKGFFGRRKNVWTVAKNAVEKAMVYAYRDRKQNKRNFRALWIHAYQRWSPFRRNVLFSIHG